MSVRIRIVAAAFVAAALSHASPAQAQIYQQYEWCDGKDNPTSDLKISGCTALIQSGKYAGNNLASVFLHRGNAYSSKKQYDRAIQDFDQAIKLNPNYALAFNNRGNAYYGKKQSDRAIQDYDQAIKLSPDFAVAFNGRGAAYFLKAQYARAIQDFDQAIKLNPDFAEAVENRAAAAAKIN